MQFTPKFWLKFSLINLLIVALLGLLMRYKIGFEFPFLDQKYLQHSHSHFAFSGWLSHTLMVLMVYFLQTKIKDFNGNQYKNIIIEIANESNNGAYDHAIISQDRIHELIVRVKKNAPDATIDDQSA